MTTTDERPRLRPRARLAGTAAVTLALLLLFGVPWLVVVRPWGGLTTIAGTILVVAAAVAFPVLMALGHGRGNDRAAVAGDTTLGVVWVLFTWSMIGSPFLLVADGRVVATAVLTVTVVLVAWGLYEALRVPAVRSVEVTLPRLGAGLDGTRVVQLTDTHYGPIDRARWSARVAEVVNGLRPDIVCHTGDIADGSAAKRRPQSIHLGSIRATLTKTYVTGNHEYIGAGADGWLEHLAELGWEALHNRHIVVSRGGDSLVIAGVDDRTAAGSGTAGHGQDHATALAGAPADIPVLLLAHQPQQIRFAVEHGVDLQLSGHTHGGQIWPFHLLVLTDQPMLAGLRRFGARTQLYTSRGTGFWGPPLRVFAPAEITLLTLRAQSLGGGSTTETSVQHADDHGGA